MQDGRPDTPPPLVLVVENDESNRELFQLVLERAGMRVVIARDAEDSRNIARDLTPDIVVTDVRMPLVDGAAFLRALRAHPAFERVPVLFVTGFLLPTDDLRVLNDNAPVAAILKPFKPDVLVQSVHSLLAGTASRAALERKHATELRASSKELVRRSKQLIDQANRLLRAKTVLLVEDDGAFRYAMGRMLRNAGVQVIETTNLEHALSALNERPEIEAIVADVVLPDGLAPDGLKQLEQQRQLPVLYVTGYSDQLLRSYGLSEQDPHLLMKPFDEATLVSRLVALGA